MALLNTEQKVMLFRPRNGIGYPNGYGLTILGQGIYGLNGTLWAIYQRRKLLSGPGFIAMKFYKPTNPNTSLQQNYRDWFAKAIIEWRALTEEQKAEYNVRAKNLTLSGYNLFIREFMLANA